MSRRRPSRQELNRTHTRTGFIGRHAERQSFYSNLCSEPEDASYLFHVHGVAGVGKSSLIRHWEGTARAAGALTAVVNEDAIGPIEAMESISAQLARQGQALSRFEIAAERYRKQRHEAEASLALPTVDRGDEPASTSSRTAAQIGLGALSLAPVIGPAAAALDVDALARGADRMRAAVSSRLRDHHDAELVLQPLRVLTPAFVQGLAEAAGKHSWVVLFFDTWERTEPLLDAWLRSFVLDDGHGELPVNVIVVVSGQAAPAAREWDAYRDLIVDVRLEVFTEAEARALLTARGVTDEALVTAVLRMSGRLPVLLDTLARARPSSPDAVDDPADTAVQRFLHWVVDPHQRAAILACALPLQLNEDIYRTAAPQEVADQYAWLRGLPFVSGRGGSCRYHEVVRVSILRLQRTGSPLTWSERHNHLADAHARWRAGLEERLAPAERWSDSTWREHRLNETYHLLCADPTLLAPALEEAVEACSEDLPTVRRWADVLTRAGTDADASALTAWGLRLQDATNREPGIMNALTELLTSAPLGETARARAHQLRGRRFFQAAHPEHALAEFTAALVVDPALVTAIADRGTACAWLGRFEEAIADFDRAVDLSPGDAWLITRRGVVQRLAGRYEQAVTSFDRAIDIDPGDAWVLAHRGVAQRLAGRYEQAVTDLDQAIRLNPHYAWAIANRGEVHRLAGRYDDAVTDLDHSIELGPEAWALTFRGEVQQLAGRHFRTVTDPDGSEQLDPDYSWAFANRGVVHRLAGRHEQAVTDLDRAIELNPHYAWAIANRGAAHRLAGRHGPARRDIEQALTIDPGVAEYLLQKAMLVTTVDGIRAATDIWRSIGVRDATDEYGALAVFLAALSVGTPLEANNMFQRFIARDVHCDTLLDALRCLHELRASPGADRSGIDRYRNALTNRLAVMRR
ncbi:tetratricopeptide repeat protein [Streptomyces pristinaespiralis]|nr:tetratricopeptide repeat protein [Streptomyces pristinaespiralis]ALC19255.1 Tetratricopeptide TPR_1 repeat-containing protein [Streptomyces pristinaespiralis]QMU17680.1 tetratricopeptide repeat protein [Streptomyces pristinaespiralis]